MHPPRIGNAPTRAELETAADSLAARLDALANRATERERELLAALLARAMTPAERMRHLDADGVLSDDERRILRTLQDPSRLT